MIESTVKAAKRMLKKTVKCGEDQYLALLNIRNTPTQGLNTSPVQRLMCSRTRTVVPIREELLNPEIPVVDTERQKMKGMQEKQASYYNSILRCSQNSKRKIQLELNRYIYVN